MNITAAVQPTSTLPLTRVGPPRERCPAMDTWYGWQFLLRVCVFLQLTNSRGELFSTGAFCVRTKTISGQRFRAASKDGSDRRLPQVVWKAFRSDGICNLYRRAFCDRLRRWI